MVSTSIAKDHTAEKKVTNFVSKPNFSPNGGSGGVCRGRGLMEISTNSEGRSTRAPVPKKVLLQRIQDIQIRSIIMGCICLCRSEIQFSKENRSIVLTKWIPFGRNSHLFSFFVLTPFNDILLVVQIGF